MWLDNVNCCSSVIRLWTCLVHTTHYRGPSFIGLIGQGSWGTSRNRAACRVTDQSIRAPQFRPPSPQRLIEWPSLQQGTQIRCHRYSLDECSHEGCEGTNFKIITVIFLTLGSFLHPVLTMSSHYPFCARQLGASVARRFKKHYALRCP